MFIMMRMKYEFRSILDMLKVIVICCVCMCACFGPAVCFPKFTPDTKDHIDLSLAFYLCSPEAHTFSLSHTRLTNCPLTATCHLSGSKPLISSMLSLYVAVCVCFLPGTQHFFDIGLTKTTEHWTRGLESLLSTHLLVSLLINLSSAYSNLFSPPVIQLHLPHSLSLFHCSFLSEL